MISIFLFMHVFIIEVIFPIMIKHDIISMKKGKRKNKNFNLIDPISPAMAPF